MKPTIENRLHGNGNLIAAAKRASRSLCGPDARIIYKARWDAMAFYSDSTIAAFEHAGELGQRGYMALPITARFIGLQEGGFFGIWLRLYNIEGDHVLNNSTVGVTTLFRNRIHIGDLSMFGLWREIAKEQLIVVRWYFVSAWQVLKIKLHLDRP